MVWSQAYAVEVTRNTLLKSSYSVNINTIENKPHANLNEFFLANTLRNVLFDRCSRVLCAMLILTFKDQPIP